MIDPLCKSLQRRAAASRPRELSGKGKAGETAKDRVRRALWENLVYGIRGEMLSGGEPEPWGQTLGLDSDVTSYCLCDLEQVT